MFPKTTAKKLKLFVWRLWGKSMKIEKEEWKIRKEKETTVYWALIIF